jgi:predicted O-methyltransferase YrrM
MKNGRRMRGHIDWISGLKDLARTATQGKENLIGIEIGSYNGESSRMFLETGKFKKLYCIDPWSPYDSSQSASLTNSVAEKEFDELVLKFPAIEKVKGFSADVFSMFQEESIDFIYIDGDHRFEEVLKDLKNYYSKIKFGGVISGHDWTFGGVCLAVDTFFKRKPENIFKDSSWIYTKTEDMGANYPLNKMSIKSRDRILILGSGPNALEDVKKINLDDFTVLGINNTWKLRCCDFVIYPHDYKCDDLFWKDKSIKIANYDQFCEKFGYRISQRGDSMFFNAVYYSVVNWCPKEIYCLGCDMDYSGEKTHFYGKGAPDPLRLSNLSYFLERVQNVVSGTKIYAVTDNEKTKLPFQQIKVDDLNGFVRKQECTRNT